MTSKTVAIRVAAPLAESFKAISDMYLAKQQMDKAQAELQKLFDEHCRLIGAPNVRNSDKEIS